MFSWDSQQNVMQPCKDGKVLIICIVMGNPFIETNKVKTNLSYILLLDLGSFGLFGINTVLAVRCHVPPEI